MIRNQLLLSKELSKQGWCAVSLANIQGAVLSQANERLELYVINLQHSSSPYCSLSPLINMSTTHLCRHWANSLVFKQRGKDAQIMDSTSSSPHLVPWLPSSPFLCPIKRGALDGSLLVSGWSRNFQNEPPTTMGWAQKSFKTKSGWINFHPNF